MLLVHIAGHADIGAPSPFEDPDKIGRSRVEELEKCTTPSEVTQRLFDFSFSQAPSRESADTAHSPH